MIIIKRNIFVDQLLNSWKLMGAHCGCWCSGATALGHPYNQCWMNIYVLDQFYTILHLLLNNIWKQYHILKTKITVVWGLNILQRTVVTEMHNHIGTAVVSGYYYYSKLGLMYNCHKLSLTRVIKNVWSIIHIFCIMKLMLITAERVIVIDTLTYTHGRPWYGKWGNLTTTNMF